MTRAFPVSAPYRLAAAGAVVLALTALAPPAAAEDWSAFLSPDPQADQSPDAAKPPLVRPNLPDQAVYVFLRYAGTVAHGPVTVQLLNGDRVIATAEKVEVGVGKTVRLTPKPAAPGVAPDKGIELTGAGYSFPLTLALRDEKDPTKKIVDVNNRPVDDLSLKLEVVRPDRYVEVAGSSTDDGIELTLTGKKFDGPKAKVELDLSRLPDLDLDKLGERALSGELDLPGSVTLFAKGLQFKPGSTRFGVVSVTVDGYRRAILVSATFQDKRQTPRYSVPGLRVELDKTLAVPGEPRKVTLAVENMPSDAFGIHWSTGAVEGSRFTAQRKETLPGDRKVTATLKFNEGALLVGTAVTDYEFMLETKGVTGRRQIRADLVKNNGDVAVSATGEPYTPEAVANLLLDGTKPVVQFTKLKWVVQRGKPLKVTVTCTAGDSGVGVVEVGFAGVNGPDGKPLPFVPAVREGEVWAATLRLPPEAKGEARIEAKAVNGVGTAAEPQAALVEVVEPKPGRGTIVGEVVWGTVRQPGLEVKLRNAKGDEVATVKSDEKGAFTFEDLEPGSYKVSATKPRFKMKGEESVTVKISEEAKVLVSITR